MTEAADWEAVPTRTRCTDKVDISPRRVSQIAAVTPYGSLSTAERLPLLLEGWEV